jgi:hypothetical protein
MTVDASFDICQQLTALKAARPPEKLEPGRRGRAPQAF